jgi:hypothetical protein
MFIDRWYTTIIRLKKWCSRKSNAKVGRTIRNFQYIIHHESIPGRGKGFFLYPLCPDRFWGPPASCLMVTGGPFPGGKALPWRDSDHSPPSSAEVGNEYDLYLLSPQAPPWRVVGQVLFITKCFVAKS